MPSPGFDIISSNILIQIADYIIKPLTHIINLSFFKGIFPQIYMRSIIFPTYKSGDTRELHNYRSIPLVSAIVKIIQKCAKHQL